MRTLCRHSNKPVLKLVFDKLPQETLQKIAKEGDLILRELLFAECFVEKFGIADTLQARDTRECSEEVRLYLLKESQAKLASVEQEIFAEQQREKAAQEQKALDQANAEAAKLQAPKPEKVEESTKETTKPEKVQEVKKGKTAQDAISKFTKALNDKELQNLANCVRENKDNPQLLEQLFNILNNKQQNILHILAENAGKDSKIPPEYKTIMDAIEGIKVNGKNPLLDNGAYVNQKDSLQQTPIQIACIKGHCPMVKTLGSNNLVNLGPCGKRTLPTILSQSKAKNRDSALQLLQERIAEKEAAATEAREAANKAAIAKVEAQQRTSSSSSSDDSDDAMGSEGPASAAAGGSAAPASSSSSLVFPSPQPVATESASSTPAATPGTRVATMLSATSISPGANKAPGKRHAPEDEEVATSHTPKPPKTPKVASESASQPTLTAQDSELVSQSAEECQLPVSPIFLSTAVTPASDLEHYQSLPSVEWLIQSDLFDSTPVTAAASDLSATAPAFIPASAAAEAQAWMAWNETDQRENDVVAVLAQEGTQPADFH